MPIPAAVSASLSPKDTRFSEQTRASNQSKWQKNKKVENEPEEIEIKQEIEEVILAAGAARQRKQDDAGAASAVFVEEIEEEKPKKKKEVTEAQRAHLANIRVKALKVKAEKKIITWKS